MQLAKITVPLLFVNIERKSVKYAWGIGKAHSHQSVFPEPQTTSLFKQTVHPKIKITSTFTYAQVIPNLSDLLKRKSCKWRSLSKLTHNPTVLSSTCVSHWSLGALPVSPLACLDESNRHLKWIKYIDLLSTELVDWHLALVFIINELYTQLFNWTE